LQAIQDYNMALKMDTQDRNTSGANGFRRARRDELNFALD